MLFFLSKVLSTFCLQYFCRVSAVRSKTEECVQVTALCARRQSGTLLVSPNNFPAQTLTVAPSLSKTEAFAVCHSPREFRTIQSMSNAVSRSLPGYTVWLRMNVALNTVVWCLGFPTSHRQSSNLSFWLSCASTYTIPFLFAIALAFLEKLVNS